MPGQFYSPLEYVEQDCGHSTPCWIWQLSRSNGYGNVYVEGRTKYAHRVYYERHKGPIPKGFQIDHLCQIRACVNPDHLEAVTQAENIRRALPKYSHAGRTLTLGSWSRETGIARATLYVRVHRLGWTFEQALTTPVRGAVR